MLEVGTWPLKKPTKEQTEYWEQVLHDHRLGMGRGRSSKVDVIGGQEDLYGAEQRRAAKKIGRVRPDGAEPE